MNLIQIPDSISLETGKLKYKKERKSVSILSQLNMKFAFYQVFLFLSILFFSSSCIPVIPEVIPDAPTNPVTPSFTNLNILTDKAIYQPGNEVTFSMDISTLPATAKVRYKYLNSVISETSVNSSSWKWTVPTDDFRGYTVEVYATVDNAETIYAVTAIDVSSVWTKFPRYGFISSYSILSQHYVDSIISDLNRLHINGLQFYDWQNKHHKPLPVVGTSPLSSWKDIGGRDNYLTTIQQYLSAAQLRGMKNMFYDLVYGAWENAEADGVSKEWYLFKDPSHINRDFFALTSPFLSNLYLLDPANTGWQNYMAGEVNNVYKYLAFDGYHMDQVGDRSTRYRYDGTNANIGNAFKPFIEAIKTASPAKYNVLNAVAQFGQQGIATSSTDFLYSEVWSPSDTYNDLTNIIKQNNFLCNNTKNSVLAAYVNYDLRNSSSYFNTPSVLMTDAVIFAFGGAHIEMGEHMLCHEYFPTNNLGLKTDLKKALINYYDFSVAYENLLRDGGTFNTIALASIDNKMTLSAWPASQGKVAVFGRKFDTRQVIHLINFSNSTTQNWRDNTGIQVQPALVKEAKVVLTSDLTVKKLWIASPDVNGGASRSLNFNQIGNKISFILPELRYWDMVVLEY